MSATSAATAPASISAARPSLQPARLWITINAILAGFVPCPRVAASSSLSLATASSAWTAPGARAILVRLAAARERW
ncbi:hypothetical protein C4D60_Mb07t07430 [Musa balbisiana]|uniref:Uncharacterized protein n=1 Tax=Musa balbisiana TaxID=52838 RepID=A0A4S8JET6_MUSBA|nr:hypothetical protein C4D60_Mb07t07430 [Musa balbisiana]